MSGTSSSPDLAIVDLGYGNIGSITVAFERIGARPVRTTDADMLRAAQRVVLPGVGAAGYAMARIDALGLRDVLTSLTQPVLGICVGMQAMFESSEEGDARGLGIFRGQVTKLSPAPDRPVPHMGWSRLSLRRPVAGLNDGDYAYFAHSFACPDGDTSLAVADYGAPVPAVVHRDNFLAVQFHPERSGDVGAAFLKGFLATGTRMAA